MGSIEAWPWRRRLALITAVALWVAAFVVSAQLQGLVGLDPPPGEYSLARWEVRHLLNKWLYALGHITDGAPDEAAASAHVSRFLDLTAQIDREEIAISDAARRDQPVGQPRVDALHAMREERDAIENDVEATIERRVTAIMRREGILHRSIFFPPVDFEFAVPPPALVTSYRDRIELRDSVLLEEDLDLEQIERIEDKAEQRNDNTSALTFPTSGIGAYPTMVEFATSYQRLLEVVAHEWMHNYLALSPLGFNYYDSPALRSMNETVASIVGDEMAQTVMSAWPLGEAPVPAQEAPRPGRRRNQPNAIEELRELRGEVDVLLADGKVEEAEALMERRRQELAARGVYYRKINQAFFAFTNLYAGSSGNPVATNPIGPKLDELRKRSATLGDFVRSVRGMSNPSDLDEALQQPSP